jgi:hypothetical protein
MYQKLIFDKWAMIDDEFLRIPHDQIKIIQYSGYNC